MGAIPAQLAARLPGGCVLLDTRVRAVTRGQVTLDDGRVLRTRAVVVATDPTTASTLLPSIGPVAMRSVTTFYHVAPEPPLDQPVLLLDGEDRLVTNTVVLTQASPSYGPAPAGSSGVRRPALISTSVLGTGAAEAPEAREAPEAPEAREAPEAPAAADLERRVRARLATLYGTDTSSWNHLATYAIEAALPVMPPGQPLRLPVRVSPGLYVCGDHRDTPSIQGAMVSGRRAAAALLADLGR
jgi:hypothetical protein